MKIAYQGISGSYSESCIKENYSGCETIACKTFDECFQLASNDNSIKAIIPEQNQLIGSINIETLILRYRLNIFAEHFFPINHNLLVLPGTKIEDIKDVYSHTAALSQTSSFIRKHNLKENVMADTAGSALYIGATKDKTKSAIASKLSAKIYGLEILKPDIQDDKVNFTRFLVFQKDIAQPEFKKDEKYITLQVEDNGVGFDVNSVKKGIGLSNMQERTEEMGGRFKMTSRPSQTILKVIIPIHYES